MLKKIFQVIFIICFFFMVLIPLVLFNLDSEKVSETEKRKLAPKPSFLTEDGKVNIDYSFLFDDWVNDNIGCREEIVELDAMLRYYGFGKIANTEKYVYGPHGELNYVTDGILASYQHTDLKTEEELSDMAEGFQAVYDYLEKKGIQMYYFQCWDKQSVYPEQFPQTIIQIGDISKTDQIVKNLSENTTVPVISPKQSLIEAKMFYDTYSKWGDVTHWTQRGAFIGYTELMNAINEKNDGKYKVLTEDDYDITVTDQGSTLFGRIHMEQKLEDFKIKNPQAYKTDEEPLWLATYAIESKRIYQNDEVDNEDTLLIIGDSYFDEFIYDDLAESFHRTIEVWGTYSGELKKIIKEYSPTIVVVENAERADRTAKLAKAGLKIKSKGE